MFDHLKFLLRSASLNIVEYNMNSRYDMRTLKRKVPYYIMSYHKSGMAKLRVGDEHYTITPPGTIIFIPPNVEHDHYKDTSKETVFLWWHFTYETAGIIDMLKMVNIPITFQLKNS